MPRDSNRSGFSHQSLLPERQYKFRVRAENIYGIGEPSAESEPVTMALVDDGEWSAVSEDGVTGLQTYWRAGLQHMFTTASCWLNVSTEVFGVTHVHCSSTGSDQQECLVLERNTSCGLS